MFICKSTTFQVQKRAVPYGIYDIAGNDGGVNVGISADTAEGSPFSD
ncbi:MAG: hypothetical protein IJ242_10590 [Clostridia bacterium]|nr:hypothetical protein [Clostridia bacterium]